MSPEGWKEEKNRVEDSEDMYKRLGVFSKQWSLSLQLTLEYLCGFGFCKYMNVCVLLSGYTLSLFLVLYLNGWLSGSVSLNPISSSLQRRYSS